MVRRQQLQRRVGGGGGGEGEAVPRSGGGAAAGRAGGSWGEGLAGGPWVGATFPPFPLPLPPSPSQPTSRPFRPALCFLLGRPGTQPTKRDFLRVVPSPKPRTQTQERTSFAVPSSRPDHIPRLLCEMTQQQTVSHSALRDDGVPKRCCNLTLLSLTPQLEEGERTRWTLESSCQDFQKGKPRISHANIG